MKRATSVGGAAHLPLAAIVLARLAHVTEDNVVGTAARPVENTFTVFFLLTVELPLLVVLLHQTVQGRREIPPRVTPVVLQYLPLDRHGVKTAATGPAGLEP